MDSLSVEEDSEEDRLIKELLHDSEENDEVLFD